MKTLAELHEVMRTWPMGNPCREDLAYAHAELSAIVRQFGVTPDRDTLRLVVALWTRAANLLEECGRYDPKPGGGGGAMEKSKEAA